MYLCTLINTLSCTWVVLYYIIKYILIIISNDKYITSDPSTGDPLNDNFYYPFAVWLLLYPKS